jgi:NTP pyrophosphatase (non-canonical NTP hydrolase)
MTFAEYQKAARKTAFYPAFGAGWVYPSLGLVSEAGEVAGKVKKVIRDHNGEMSEDFKQTIKQELGDVLWYVAQLCSELELDMSEVAQANVDKLASRQERGVLGGSGDKR